VTLVGSQCVEARSVVADVGIALALVDVDAGIAAGSQRVAVVADALERSLEVVAVAVVADSGTFVAFVDIGAVSASHSEFVTVGADTLETSGRIDTLRVSTAWIRQSAAFVIIDTLVRFFIVDVSAMALAFEATGNVHADAVLAHLRHQSTLVDLSGKSSHRIDDRSWSSAAQLQVFT